MMARQNNPRAEKRSLVRWTDDMDKRLLLYVQYACSDEGIKIPWAKVAAAMGPNITDGACIQHLAKLRSRMLAAEMDVPPPLRRRGPAPISTAYSGGPRGRKWARGTTESTSKSVKVEEEPNSELDETLNSEGESVENDIAHTRKSIASKKRKIKEEDDSDDAHGAKQTVSSRSKKRKSKAVVDEDSDGEAKIRNDLKYGRDRKLKKHHNDDVGVEFDDRKQSKRGNGKAKGKEKEADRKGQRYDKPEVKKTKLKRDKDKKLILKRTLPKDATIKTPKGLRSVQADHSRTKTAEDISMIDRETSEEDSTNEHETADNDSSADDENLTENDEYEEESSSDADVVSNKEQLGDRRVGEGADYLFDNVLVLQLPKTQKASRIQHEIDRSNGTSSTHLGTHHGSRLGDPSLIGIPNFASNNYSGSPNYAPVPLSTSMSGGDIANTLSGSEGHSSATSGVAFTQHMGYVNGSMPYSTPTSPFVNQGDATSFNSHGNQYLGGYHDTGDGLVGSPTNMYLGQFDGANHKQRDHFGFSGNTQNPRYDSGHWTSIYHPYPGQNSRSGSDKDSSLHNLGVHTDASSWHQGSNFGPSLIQEQSVAPISTLLPSGVSSHWDSTPGAISPAVNSGNYFSLDETSGTLDTADEGQTVRFGNHQDDSLDLMQDSALNPDEVLEHFDLQ